MHLNVVAGGERLGQLFLAHGRQRSLDSDRFSFASRIFVWHGWHPRLGRLCRVLAAVGAG